MNEIGFYDGKLRTKDGKIVFGCCNCSGLPDGCYYAILICNSNDITDDDFDIYLNGGSPIGEFLGSTVNDGANCPCRLFVTHALLTADVVPMTVCCREGANATGGTVVISDALFTPTGNTLLMDNKADNEAGNYGIVQVLAIWVYGGVVTNVVYCLDDEYYGDSGLDFTYNFDQCPCDETPPCCPDATGDLTATPTGVNTYELCATTNGTPVSGDCAGLETTIHWTGVNTSPASGVLGNGDCEEITTTDSSPSITWWVVDGLDCEGDPTTIPLWNVTCSCCDKQLNRVYVTLSGWFVFDQEVCYGCLEINGTFELKPLGSETDTCTWKYSSALGDGPNIPCLPISAEHPLGYEIGLEIIMVIECHDDKLIVTISVDTIEGTATYYKEVSIPGVSSISPGDCSLLEGDIPIDPSSVVVGGCNPASSNCSLDLVLST